MAWSLDQIQMQAVVHLISKHYHETGSPKDAMARSLKIFRRLCLGGCSRMGVMAGARKVLAVGYGDQGMYLEALILWLTHLTNRIAYLEGDWVILSEQRRDLQ